MNEIRKTTNDILEQLREPLPMVGISRDYILQPDQEKIELERKRAADTIQELRDTLADIMVQGCDRHHEKVAKMSLIEFTEEFGWQCVCCLKERIEQLEKEKDDLAERYNDHLVLTGAKIYELERQVREEKCHSAFYDLTLKERNKAWAEIEELNVTLCSLQHLKQYLIDAISKFMKVIEILRDASIQSHSGHWDPQGTYGANCPECRRAHKLRNSANEILKGVPIWKNRQNSV